MAQDRSLIERKVGDGGQIKGRAVTALHQLMSAAGLSYVPVRPDAWTSDAFLALDGFRKGRHRSADSFYIEELRSEIGKTSVEPGDATLFHLAEAANILIPLPRACGWGGVAKLNSWFRDKKIRYQKGAESGGGTRATYALRYFEGWAVQSINRGWNIGPVQMDCTTYVNMAVSVYLSGDLTGRYDADCSQVGGTSRFKLARDRYGFQEVVRQTEDLRRGRSVPMEFRNGQDIEFAINDRSESSLYVVERAIANDNFVTHLALIRRGKVHEFNTMAPIGGCQLFERSVGTFAVQTTTRGGHRVPCKYLLYSFQ